MILAVLGFACLRVEYSSMSIPPRVEWHDDG
jgi:hypothetical protein